MSSRMPSLLSTLRTERAYAGGGVADKRVPAERETPLRPRGAPGRFAGSSKAQPVNFGCTCAAGRAQTRNDMLRLRALPAPATNRTRARTRWTPAFRRRGSRRAVYRPLTPRVTVPRRLPSTKNVTLRMRRPWTRRLNGLTGQVFAAAMRAVPRTTRTPLTALAGAGVGATTGVTIGPGGGGGGATGGGGGGSFGIAARQDRTSNFVSFGNTSTMK